MRLPNVVHLGFAKCGSTFLQAYWRQHPHVHLVFKANHFSPLEDCSYDQGPRKYAEHFEAAKAGQVLVESDEHMLMAVFHPLLRVHGITHDSVDEVCRRLQGAVPQAKIVLVIRNQLELLISTYSQYLLGGGTLGLQSFAEELLSRRHGDCYFSFHYDRIIETLQSYFPGQVKVILNEEMAQNTERYLHELSAYMMVPNFDFKPSFRDRRVGLSRFGMGLVWLLNRLVVCRQAPRIEPQMWIPKRVYKTLCNVARVFEYYVLKHFSAVKRLEMASATLKAMVASEYAESNQRLSVMLDKDLSAMGYVLPAGSAPRDGDEFVEGIEEVAREEAGTPLVATESYEGSGITTRI